MERPRFTFRPVLSSDKEAVTALCAKIWEGEDYLPYLFDDWVEDTDGAFNACLLDGRLIGLGKVSFLADGHAWLEGLRKDPDAGVTGVGRALCLEALRFLETRRPLSSIRFSAYAHNPQTIALNEAIGFRRIGTWSIKSKLLPGHPQAKEPYGRPLTETDASGYRIRRCDDRTEVLDAVRGEGWLDGYRIESWKAFPLIASPALCPDDVVLEAIDSEGARRGVLVHASDPLRRQINLVAFQADDNRAAAALLKTAEDASRDAGYHYIETIAPRSGNVLQRLNACGYESWKTEDDFYLYEWPPEKLRVLSG